nr:immunoglobulin light chain junction region [Macaca mulatta]
CFQDKQLPVTF